MTIFDEAYVINNLTLFLLPTMFSLIISSRCSLTTRKSLHPSLRRVCERFHCLPVFPVPGSCPTSGVVVGYSFHVWQRVAT